LATDWILFLIPVINLQRNQNPNNYKKNLPNRIQQVFTELIISKKSLTDLAEEAVHGWVGYLIKLQKSIERVVLVLWGRFLI
jgi:hypothetical protein